jgi:hypothetical protein
MICLSAARSLAISSALPMTPIVMPDDVRVSLGEAT